KSVAVKNGRQIATIESKGSIGLGGENAPDKSKFAQTFTAVTDFDVSAGEPVTSKMDMDMKVDPSVFAAAAGAAPGGDQAPASGLLAGMTLSGTIHLNIGAPTAGPTPQKAPAKRSPTRR